MMTDLIETLRSTLPKDSGYAETANAAADEIERLREAIKPFANWGGIWPSPEDNLTVVAYLHVNHQYEAHLGTEDFRRARAALT